MVRFLADLPRFVFFTGKGGVGKTSLACATAVHLADAGRRVLLVSTDPASNVGQVFGVTIGAQVTPVPGVDGLAAIEIDPQQAAQAYRERIVGPVRDLLPAAEIASITEQLSGSCTTEVASFNEFTALLADDHAIAAYDHVVFDTAPTGHTIRLLQLPGEWTEFLDAGKGDASCLGPMAGLDRARSTYATALARLADPAWTRLVLVARAQASSLAEAARTATELAQIGITDQHLVVNGVLPPDVSGDRLAAAIHQRESRALADLPPALAGMPCTHVPLRADTIVGVAAVRRLLADESVSAAGDARPAPTGLAADVPDLGLPVLEVPRPALPGLDRLVEELARQDHGLVMCMGKGGVGKTTVAAAIAVALADRGHAVHLTTTDPAGHLDEALGTDSSDAQVLAGADGPGDGGVQVGGGARITVSRIDPRAATAAYQEKVLATKGASLDEAGRARLAEDLLSPCTEEVAVFGQFSHLVHQARRQFVVMDTAPTGHTLLLMDATGSYHRDVVRNLGGSDSEGGGASGGGSGGRTAYTTPLMRLRDPDLTRVVIVTLPDTTPVLEAEALQADLERADIHPWAWVVNSSLAAAKPTSSLLAHRAAAESPHLTRVGSLAPRTAVIPLLADEPVGVERLRSLVHQRNSKDTPVTETEKSKPSVLFVCVHNAGRSQMGAAYTTHLSGGAVEVRSAGSAPAETINPAVREAMLEEGIDISAEKPKILTTEAVQASDVVITMGCGDTCPYFPGKRYLDWVLEDPAGQGVASVRPIRDEIKRRVLGLLGELGVEPVELGR